MTTIQIDKEKVRRMVEQGIKMFSDTGAHPAEVVIAFAQISARVIDIVGDMSQGAPDIVKRELFDLHIKTLTDSLLELESRIRRAG